MEEINGIIEFTKEPICESFMLHSHDFYEIYIFIEGDTDYIVEGTRYNLEKYDAILLSPNEMHRPFHKSIKPYKRMIFSLSADFFEINNCSHLLKAFNNREFGTQNKISSKVLKSSGCLDAINRWLKYTDNGRLSDSVISKAIIIEILYLLNNTDILFEESSSNDLTRQVISYINNNYTEKISLDELSAKFYVSKYYLCHMFKNSTGYTITEFINNKRIMHTQALCKEGMTISAACVNAGFSNYSSFYAAQKKFGKQKNQG